MNTTNPPLGPTAGDEALDAAWGDVDPLLAASLRREQQERRRRRVIYGGIAVSGITIGAAAGTIGVLLAQGVGRAEPPTPSDAGAAVDRAASIARRSPGGEERGDGDRAARPTFGPANWVEIEAGPSSLDRLRWSVENGWVLWHRGEYAEAEASFRRALSMDDDFPAAWTGLGWCRLFRGDRADAGRAFDRALDIDPRDKLALAGRGQVRFMAGDLSGAEGPLREAAEAGAVSAWWGLAELHLIRGEFADAEPWARRIARSDPADSDAAALLAAAESGALPDDLRARIAPTP